MPRYLRDMTGIKTETFKKHLDKWLAEIPRYLGDMTGIKTETFKKYLDKWLAEIPDQPKCGRYAGCTEANSNSIRDQCQVNRTHKW